MSATKPSTNTNANPRNPDFWTEPLARRDARPSEPWNAEERATLWEFNQRVGAGADAESEIESLGDPATLAVVAGQQAGLFVSPLYAILKAMAALRWARRLRRILAPRPVVAVFWIASEDHDFDEVRHVHHLDRQGRVARWSYSPAAGDEEAIAGRSVFDIPLDNAPVEEFLAEIEANAHDSEFKAPMLAQWRAMLAASENLEDFFARGVAWMLQGEGLILLPSRLEPIRRRAAAVIGREIDRPGQTTELVRQTAEDWKRKGKKSPLHRRGDEANFFLYRSGRRQKVTVDGDAFRADVRRSADELREELLRAPENFSPNVITRAVVQDVALPALAVIAGPGEMRYWSFLADAGVHDFFNVPASTPLRRPRAMLIEPRLARTLHKFGVDADDLEREDWAAIEEKAARSGDFGEALDAMAGLEQAADQAFAQLKEHLGPLAAKPSLASALEKTARSWKRSAGQLETRLRKEIEQENQAGDGADRLERLFDALRPAGKPQERVLGPAFPFLLDYGREFISWMLDSLDLDRPEGVQTFYLKDIHAWREESKEL